MVEADKPHDSIMRHMRSACWMPKPTNIHSKFVLLIAFPVQQWLHERASMLRYTYIGCVIVILTVNQWRTDGSGLGC